MNYESQKRYCEKNCVGFYMKLNRKTDADILAWLDNQENKQGKIKELIRNEMKSR